MSPEGVAVVSRVKPLAPCLRRVQPHPKWGFRPNGLDQDGYLRGFSFTRETGGRVKAGEFRPICCSRGFCTSQSQCHVDGFTRETHPTKHPNVGGAAATHHPVKDARGPEKFHA